MENKSISDCMESFKHLEEIAKKQIKLCDELKTTNSEFPCKECSEWAQECGYIFKEHHPGCSKYNLEKDLVSLIKRLLKGIERWAGDEDGVHPDCWDVYKEAKIRLGEPVSEEEA